MPVHVVGRVITPGRVRVPSVATLFDALTGAGGITKDGTLRKIILRRAGAADRTIDLYGYLLEGDVSVDVSLSSDDVIVVPVVGPRVALVGRVLRPAIYELEEPKTSFAALLSMSGGYARLASSKTIQIESVGRDGLSIRTVDLESVAPDKVIVGDGAVVMVGSASPKLENAVFLVGNVTMPGRYAFRPGLTVADVVTLDALVEAGFWLRESMPNAATEAGKKAFTTGGKADPFLDYPEPYFEHAMIRRIDPQTKQESRLAFNLGKAIFEKDPCENHSLQVQDTIVIYPRSAFESPRQVTVTGAVHQPGSQRFSAGMRVRDLLRMSGGLLPQAHLESGLLTRTEPHQSGSRFVQIQIDLAAAVAGDESANLLLQPDDTIAIKVVPDYRKSYAVTVSGEVRQPGTYTMIPGEHLSDLIRRAGGFTGDAYLPAAQFYRQSVQQLQQERMNESLTRLETETKLAAQRYTAEAGATGETVDVKAEQARVERLISAISATKAKGRMVIRIQSPEKLVGTNDDLVLADGDQLSVPRRPDEVHVLGAVFNQNALIHQPGLKARDYLQECGGPSEAAEIGLVYIIRADGSADGAQSARRNYQWDGSRGRYSRGNLLSSEMYPGDTLVVPYDVKPQLSKLGLTKTITEIIFHTALATGVIVALL
jgi:protein involved in polysaccharide export with SLBB domain